MFKNTIKQFLYVTLQEKTNAINILGKYVYRAEGSISRNSGAVNKKLTIQGECVKAIPHNSKCRYGERGTAAAKPKAQIILDAAKVSAASGGNSEPKQGQRSQSARDFCPRSTMRVPQPNIIEHFGNADAVPQPPKRCLSRKAGIVRYCPRFSAKCPCLHGKILIRWECQKSKKMACFCNVADFLNFRYPQNGCTIERNRYEIFRNEVRTPRPG